MVYSSVLFSVIRISMNCQGSHPLQIGLTFREETPSNNQWTNRNVPSDLSSAFKTIYTSNTDAVLFHEAAQELICQTEISPERELLRLRQTTSVSEYAADFLRLKPYVDWSEIVLAACFYKGLKKNVKNRLAELSIPTSLQDLIQTSIRARARIMEKEVAIALSWKGDLGIQLCRYITRSSKVYC